MKSVILISPNKNEIFNLFNQWKANTKSIFANSKKLNIRINKERIYIDYIENGLIDYDDDEISQIALENPSFYLICYSDKKTMKFFLQKSEFSQGSYIDNDFGKIVLVKDLQEAEIVNFIE